MSYARWNCDGSDVYVYGSNHGDDCEVFVCHECKMGPCDDTGNFFTQSKAEMIEHLRRHLVKGDCVPDNCFEQLSAEDDWGVP